MKGEALKGHLDLLLLSALVEGPLHGYAVIQALGSRSGGVFELPEGTVYPALRRLEQAGLLASRWSNASARRRRIYRITRTGKRELKRQRQAWGEFRTAVQRVVGASA